MILKINNMLDKELFKNELEMLPGCVQETINERLQTLEEAFGNPYLESGFGNVAIYIFTDVTEENKIKVNQILEFYNINVNDELYEYSEVVGENHLKNEVIYTETLYLLGNGEKSLLIFCAFK